MTQRIKNAIDIWLDAVNNGTLAKATCAACAVGNLVAHGLKGEINEYLVCDKENTDWANLFVTGEGHVQNIDLSYEDHKEVIKNIKATEFSWQELAKIEKAFETNTKIRWTRYNRYTKEEIRADQLKGLAACVQVMLNFDNCDEKVETFYEMADKILV